MTLEKSKLIPRGKMSRAASLVMVVALVLMMTMSVASAAGISNIEDGVTSGAKQIYDLIKAIVTPLAVVVLAGSLLMVLFGGEKGLDKAKKIILIIVVVLAGVYLAPVIITTVTGWFQNGSAGTDVWGDFAN